MRLVSVTLKNPKVSQMIKRNFVPYAVDANAAPPEVQALFAKGGGAIPMIFYLNDKGQFVKSTNGFRSPEQILSDMEAALTDKTVSVPKTKEAELNKQLAILEKALGAKNNKQATTAYSAMKKIKGYSSLKEKAFELIETAQAEGSAKTKEAVALAAKDQYSEAREILIAVGKEFAGLPIADEVKDDLAALKLLESASKTISDKKGSWKSMAVSQLAQIANKYGETPFGELAAKRRSELLK